MKLKGLLVAGLLSLGLVGCGEKTPDYSGTYRENDGTTMILEKIGDNEYKLTKNDILGGTTVRSVYIKNKNHLYNSMNEYKGEFVDHDFKTAKGILYSKVK